MNKDTKVLLMAVVIILVALVSFNLSDLTGKVVSSSITVTPGLVTFARYQPQAQVTITVNVGNNQVDDDMYLYRVGARGRDTRVGTVKVDLCDRTASSCTQSGLKDRGKFTFNLPATLGEGTYRFKITDSKTSNILVAESNSFLVRHAE